MATVGDDATTDVVMTDGGKRRSDAAHVPCTGKRQQVDHAFRMRTSARIDPDSFITPTHLTAMAARYSRDMHVRREIDAVVMQGAEEDLRGHAAKQGTN